MDPARYKPGKNGGMCISALEHFSFYERTYRQDGTGADETTEPMSGLDGYRRNVGGCYSFFLCLDIWINIQWS